MAVKSNKHAKGKRRRPRHAVKGGTTRLINPALTAPSGNGAGILRPDTAEMRLPDALIEASDNSERKLMPGNVTLTITILAITFIAIITWFVSQMPEK